MARFFVGQRVRVVKVARGWEFLLGAETKLVAPSPPDKKYSDWQIAMTDPDNGGPLYVAECNIAPILPAHEPVAISAILEEFPSLAGVMGVVA